MSELAVEKMRNLPPWFNVESDYARRLRREAGMSQYGSAQYWQEMVRPMSAVEAQRFSERSSPLGVFGY